MALFHSIRFRTALILTISVAAVFFVYQIFIAPQLEKNTLEEAIKYQGRLTQSIAHNIDFVFKKNTLELERLASLSTFRRRDKKGMQSLLTKMDSVTSSFNYFFVIDTSAHWLVYPRRPDLVSDSIPEQNREWVRNTIEQRRTTYLGVLQSRVNTLVSGFATPIFNYDSTVIGVLRGVFVISRDNIISEITQYTDLSPKSALYIVSDKGRLLAHSSMNLDYSDFQNLNYNSLPPVQMLKSRTSGVIGYSKANTELIASVAPIVSTGWGVIIEQPKASLSNPAQKSAALTTTIFLVAFIMTAIFLQIVLEYSLRPLTELVHRIQNNASADISVKSQDLSEIGVLTKQFRDLYTKLYDSREKLSKSEELFRNVITQSIDGISIVDTDGTIVIWNPALEAMSGITSAEAIGQKIWDIQYAMAPQNLQTTEHLDKLKAMIRGLLSSGIIPPGAEIHEREIYCKDGSKKLLQGSIFPIRSSKGTMLGSITRDITKQRSMEEQLMQSGKLSAIGQLAGGIAHDFNNQLAGISGYIEVIRDELQETDTVQPFIEGILTAVERSADLTAQLLAFARKGKFRNENIDIHTIVDEVSLLLKHSLDKRIDIVVNKSARQHYIVGDPSQIQNALLNLALNARDAMGDGGILTIETNNTHLRSRPADTVGFDMFVPGEYLVIAVSDTGSGMDKETVKKAFDPFFTTKETGKGTGMGLSAVYGTTQAHNGGIAIKSEPGRGTTVHFYLPPTQRKVLNPDESAAPPLTGGKKRILICEDEEAISIALQKVLTKLGHIVECTANGKELLDWYAVHNNEVDIIILDLTMPVMSGNEAFLEIRKINPRVPVIITSGYSFKEFSSHVSDTNYCTFLQKPFKKQDLIKALDDLTGKTRPH